MRESPIQRAILLAIGGRADLGKFARRNRGRAYRDLPGGGRQYVEFGDFDGAADLTGLLVDGRRVELEVKAARGSLTEEQRNFGAMVQANGGVWAVVRSPEEAIAVLEGALRRGPGVRPCCGASVDGHSPCCTFALAIEERAELIDVVQGVARYFASLRSAGCAPAVLQALKHALRLRKESCDG